MHSHSGCHNNDDDDDCDGGVGDGNIDNDANSNFYDYRRGSKDHRDRVAIQAPEELRYKCYCYVLIIIGHFRVSKTLTFKMRPSALPFWLKWVLFAWEWKIISISKAEHLTSFWNRGPGETRKWPVALARWFLNLFHQNKNTLWSCFYRHKKDILLFNSVCNMTSIKPALLYRTIRLRSSTHRAIFKKNRKQA